MLCPCCNTLLKDVTRTGIPMNRCPTCKGVWLHHDAVEKLCDRLRTFENAWEEEQRRFLPQPHYYDDDDHYYLRYTTPTRMQKRHPCSAVFKDLE